MRFHEHILASFIPDFVEVQQTSFSNLLKKGISKELSKINPIRDRTENLELFFYPQYYILTRPTCTPTEAILRKKSYTSKLYVPVQITVRPKCLTTLHWFLLCDLPLMTKRGSFIFNGSPRVVVNQLMRSPGVYYNYRIIRTMTTTVDRYYADIIPKRGTWLRLEYNKIYSYIKGSEKERVWARMKRVQKISGFLFLLCFKAREWNYWTKKTGYPSRFGLSRVDTGLAISKVYPFLSDLKQIFFKYNFVKQGQKEKDWVESFQFHLQEEWQYEAPNYYYREKKKRKVKRKRPNLMLDTEFVIKKIGIEENKPIEQVLESTDYPFALLFLESGGNVDGLARILSGSQHDNLKEMIKHQFFDKYTAEQLVELGILFISTKFFNKKKYNLGFMARLRLNKKFNQEEKKMTLTQSDVFYALNYLFIFKNNPALRDDIDNLKNKRVKASGELIENQLTTGLLVLKKLLCKKINLMIKPARSSAVKPIVEDWRESFSSLYGEEAQIPLELFQMGKKGLKKQDLVQNKTTKTTTTKKTNKTTKTNKTNKTTKTNKTNKATTTEDSPEKDKRVKFLVSIKNKKKVKPLKRLIKNIEILSNTKPINGTLRVFFGSCPLSQYLDQTNPLADITHKRRVSCLGPGGLSRETAGMSVRNIHPTHYGRVCPIETPEGRNAGLVNSVAIYGRLNRYGYLQTPFYNLLLGNIQKRDTSKSDQRPTFFSVEQEKYIKEAPGDTRFGRLSFLQTLRIPIKIGTDYSDVVNEEAEYRALNPIQMISIATSLIPFLEHNDATRALMGSNMQRQSLPIIFPERAIVGTGLEARVAAESGHTVQSRLSGYVSYASGERIVIFGNLTLPKEKRKEANPSSVLGLKSYTLNELERDWDLKSKATFYPFSVNGRLQRGDLSNLKNKWLLIIGNQNEQIKEIKKFSSRNRVLERPAFKTSKTRLTSKTISKDVQASKTAETNQPRDFKIIFGKLKNTKTLTKKLQFFCQWSFLTNPGFGFTPITILGKESQLYFKNSQINKYLGLYFCYRYKSSLECFHLIKVSINFQLNLFNWYLKPKTFKAFEDKKDHVLKKDKKDFEKGVACKTLSTNNQVSQFSFQSHQPFNTTPFIYIPKSKTNKGARLTSCFKKILNYKEKSLDVRLSDISKLSYKSQNQPLIHLIDLDYKNKDFITLFFIKVTQSKSRPTSLYAQRQLTKHMVEIDGLSGNPASLYEGSLLFFQLTCVTCSRFRLLKHDIIHSLRLLFSDKTSEKINLKKSDKTSDNNEKSLSGFASDPLLATHHSGTNPKKSKAKKKLRNPVVPRFFKTQELVPQEGLKSPFMCIKESKVHSLESYQRSNQATCLSQRPSVAEGEWVQRGDLLADCSSSVLGDLSVGKNILVAYMPWQGYNFEDAVLISDRLVYDDIYTSIHIERFSLSSSRTTYGQETISRNIPWENEKTRRHLDKNGVGMAGIWLEEKDILIGKLTPLKEIVLTPHQRLFYDVLGEAPPSTYDTSLRLPQRMEGKVINVEILETTIGTITSEMNSLIPSRVHLFFAERLKIQIGDKISGRHGNKGIISNILPRQDMPYLLNGTPVDMVLNPLGVPSRMNVGQVFETLLGLAGIYLNESFKINGFISSYGKEVNRSLVYSKLYQARLKSGENWLFNPEFPGKTRVFDGRTGFCFDQSVTVGQSYILKLIHLVDHKIHARSTGPYSRVTQQPLKGRSKRGGQRVGEMEVWALQAFGAAHTLQEILTIKSDDISNREKLKGSILNDDLLFPNITLQNPEIFKVLIAELQSLSLGLELYDKFTPINVTDFIKSGKKKRMKIEKKDHNNKLLKQPESTKITSSLFYIKIKVFLVLHNRIGKNVSAPKYCKLSNFSEKLSEFRDPLTFKLFCFLNINYRRKYYFLSTFFVFLNLLKKQEETPVLNLSILTNPKDQEIKDLKTFFFFPANKPTTFTTIPKNKIWSVTKTLPQLIVQIRKSLKTVRFYGKILKKKPKRFTFSKWPILFYLTTVQVTPVKSKQEIITLMSDTKL